MTPRALVPSALAVPEEALTERELVAWGERLGRTLEPPFAILLSGDLGAGKTTLAQAICAGYGVREDVTSPTFALVHVYQAPRSVVYHADLYRLDGRRDLQNIGWDDMVSAASILIVEWPDRADGELPPHALWLELAFAEGDVERRRIRGRPLGRSA